MKTLTENQYLAYHYSSKKFDYFDKNKCDGFWFTDIEPSDVEMLDEIGANGSNFVAKCIITINEELNEGNNYDVFESLESAKCDGMICLYDGFKDYAVLNNEQIEVLEWIEL